VAIQEIVAYLDHLQNVDQHVPALLEGLSDDMIEGNRINRLSGLDKFDRPLEPCSYRNTPVRPQRGARPAALYGTKTVKHYLGPEMQLGNILHAASPGNGNLTTAEYEKLTGPPLAPRGSRSRTIANFYAQWFSAPGGTNAWIVEGAWLNVISKKGVPFLPYHFAGDGRLPQRDLQGVAPSTMVVMQARVDDWVQQLMGGP
jgi:hypothetical protein